jgi:hypothetical protein
MIYTDKIHLASDRDLEELHTFAESIGLKKCWFHRSKHHPHYDLTNETIRAKAIESGAVYVRSKRLLTLMLNAGVWTPALKRKVK